MSNLAFRDSSVVIIETGRTKLRAIFGLADLLKTPSVEVQARVGLRRNTPSRPSGLRDNSSEEVNGAIGSRAPSQPAKTRVRLNEYLVGQQLDDALAAGEDISISWPFTSGDVKDFDEAEVLWKYVLFTMLGLKRKQNESPVLLTFPHGISRDSHEHVCQIFFERFNSAAVSILERPLAQLYAANALNGLVVDIGEHRTDITPIYECFIQHNCADYMPVGLHDCEVYLADILSANESVVSTFSPPDAPLEPEELRKQLVELAHHAWKGGLVRLEDAEAAAEGEDEGVTNIAAVLVAGKEKAVIETGMKKRMSAKASAAELARAKEIEALDLVTVEFKEKEITLGRERHRFLEPLFDPSVLQGVEGLERKDWRSGSMLPIQDLCGLAVAKADLDARMSIWDGLFVTGDCTSLIKGIGVAIQSRLAPYILSNPDPQNDAQPKQVRVIHVPEYFAEYRERGDGLASFLGASIVAKVIFADPLGKNFVSKADYTSKGPRAVLEMSPSLL